MKHCTRCDRDLPLDSFRWKNKERGLRQGYCIECNISYNKEHYQNNKDKYSTKTKKYKAEQYAQVLEYLRQHPCVDCGEDDIVCLEFDHRDRKDKVISISEAITNKWSWSRIQSEIKKCDVRCRNCHAKVTAKQLGWSKALGPLV